MKYNIGDLVKLTTRIDYNTTTDYYNNYYKDFNIIG